jgi:Flp pilus assembly protein TadD
MAWAAAAVLVTCLAPPAPAQNPRLDGLLAAAERHIGQEQYAQAIAALERSRTIAPGLPGIYKQLGYCHWKLGNLRQARVAFEKELELDRDAAYARYYLGRIHLSQGNLEGAIAQFEEIRRPEGLDLDYQLGTAYLGAGRLEAAIARLERAVAAAPGLQEARNSLARAYGLAGRPADARREIARARELSARVQQSIRDLGELESLLKSNKAEQAAAIARELARSDDPDLLVNVGMLLGRHGLHREALVPLERAARLRPTLFEAHYNIGLSYASAGEPAGAEAALRRAVELNAGSYDAHKLLGLVLVQAGRGKEALVPLARAVELRSDDPRLLALLGAKYLEARRYPQAAETLVKAAAADPGNPEPHLFLSQAYRALGRREAAEAEKRTFEELARGRAAP